MKKNAKKGTPRSKQQSNKPRKIKSNAAKSDDVCATVGCDAPAAMTYLGRPRCQACFEVDTTEGHPEHDPPVTEPAATQPAEPKPKRVSALDAAAQVLQASGQPMRTKDLIAAMATQGLWSSPGGKTPHATLYAAMMREIGTKGAGARFRKTDRGQFESAG